MHLLSDTIPVGLSVFGSQFLRLQLICGPELLSLKAYLGLESASKDVHSNPWQVSAGCWQEADSSLPCELFHRLLECALWRDISFPSELMNQER